MTRKQTSTPTWHTGEAVAQLLGESNRAKAAAALGMGTTVTSMYRWLKEQEWPQRNIQKAATYFGVSEEWLMFGTGEKYVGPDGGNDPYAAQIEVLNMRMEAEIKRVLASYVKQVRKVYAPDDAQTPPTPKGKRREWESKPKDVLD